MRRAYSLTPLFISLFIYLFYRTEKTVVNELIMAIISNEHYIFIRRSVVDLIPLHDIVVFCLPGGLWTFCATLFARGFYLQIGSLKIQLVLVPILFAVVLEFFQLFQLTTGTFDIWDLISFCFFWLLAYVLSLPREQQNILSPFTFQSFICLACFFSVYLAHVVG